MQFLKSSEASEKNRLLQRRGHAARGPSEGSRRALFVAVRCGVLLGLVGAATGAEAQPAGATGAECRSNPHLSRARELYEELQFDEAGETLQRAIEYAGNCKFDLAEIYRLKGFVDAVNGQRERCHRDFEILLALNPDHEMPQDLPPKIRSCWEDARLVAPSRRTLKLEHDPLADVPPNTPVSLKVKVVDPLRLVDQVKVYFRREGVKVFTVVSARADDTVSIVIPALALPPDVQGYKMEYIVRAVDRWDGVLAEEGGPRRPLTFGVLEGDVLAGNVFGQWWFWTAIAAAVVGAGAVAVAVAQSGGESIPLEIVVKGVE